MSQNIYEPKGCQATSSTVNHTSCGAVLYVCLNGDSIPMPDGCRIDPSILPEGLTAAQLLEVTTAVASYLAANPCNCTISPTDFATLLAEYMLLNNYTFLTSADVIKIVGDALTANTSNITTQLMQAVAAHPDAVDVQDAIGTHLYYAIQ